MDYSNLLSRSWHVVWDHKFMIVLGFLAALGSGMSSNGNNFNYKVDGSEFQNLPFIDAPFSPPNFNEILPVLGAMAAGLICVAVIIGIALWILRLTAEAGMIDSASRLDAGQKVTFSEAMSTGWSKIWSFIALDLILFGTVFLVIMIALALMALTVGGSIAAGVAGGANTGQDFADMVGPLMALGGGVVGLICCLLCVLFIFFILIMVITNFSRRAIVLENRGVVDGIQRAWEVIRANLGDLIILLILFMVLSLIVGLITAAVALPLGALAIAPGAARLLSGGTLGTLDVILMVIGGLAVIVVVAAIRSFYTAFESSAYTLAFQEFTDKQIPEAKIE
ncbi:MAG: hypothetical protein AB8I52_07985 [Candidatus Promineifilaceae bacterium]|jgi:hypothetical protein